MDEKKINRQMSLEKLPAEQLQRLYDRTVEANTAGKKQFITHKQLMEELKKDPSVLKNFQNASDLHGFSDGLRGNESAMFEPNNYDYLKVKKELKNNNNLNDLVKEANERFDFSELIKENKPQPESYDDALKAGTFFGESSMPQEETDKLGQLMGSKSFEPRNNSYEKIIKHLTNKGNK